MYAWRSWIFINKCPGVIIRLQNPSTIRSWIWWIRMHISWLINILLAKPKYTKSSRNKYIPLLWRDAFVRMSLDPILSWRSERKLKWEKFQNFSTLHRQKNILKEHGDKQMKHLLCEHCQSKRFSVLWRCPWDSCSQNEHSEDQCSQTYQWQHHSQLQVFLVYSPDHPC